MKHASTTHCNEYVFHYVQEVRDPVADIEARLSMDSTESKCKSKCTYITKMVSIMFRSLCI